MKGKLCLSLSLGALFALLTALLLRRMPGGGLIGTLAGLMFAAAMLLFLVIHRRVMDQRYAQIEAEFTSPIFCRANGNFNLGDRVKNGNIYLCEAGIVCVSLDEKPYTLDELPRGSMDHISFDQTHFYIYAKDGRMFLITTPKAREMAHLLIEKEWFE